MELITPTGFPIIALLLAIVWGQLIATGFGNRLWPQPQGRIIFIGAIQVLIILLCMVWANFIAFYCFSNRVDMSIIKIAPIELQLFLIVLFTCPLFWKLQQTFLSANRSVLRNEISMKPQLRYTTSVFAGLTFFTLPLTQQLLLHLCSRSQTLDAQLSGLLNTGMLFSLLPMAVAANTVIMVILDFKPQSLVEFQTTFHALEYLNNPDFGESLLESETDETLRILEEHALRIANHDKAALIARVKARRQENDIKKLHD
jgi:hypothetical protein